MKFPAAVQDEMGFALFRVQIGETHHKIKSLKGLGRGVQEIISKYQTNTYRAVYTVQFEDVVDVLHAFQKKAKKGVTTPKPDIEMIRQRLKEAKKLFDKQLKVDN